MPLDPEKLLALRIPDVEHTYGPRDCILYALGLGLGQDPLNAEELAFVYEKNIKALPTFAVMQAYAAYWLRLPDIGVTWEKVVHGEQGLKLHAPVAPQGTVIGRTRILDVVDKGEGNGALRLTTARYYTPSGRSIQAQGITPEIEVMQEVPADVAARMSSMSEATLPGHLKATGAEQKGSQAYVPPDAKDDRALQEALALLRGTKTNPAFPPNPKQADLK